MSVTFDTIKGLVAAGDVRISVHAFDRMKSHAIQSSDLTVRIDSGEVLEDYPEYHAGPTVLVLHYDALSLPIHAVWGIEKATQRPAVLVTAYRPDPAQWSDDFRRRKP